MNLKSYLSLTVVAASVLLTSAQAAPQVYQLDPQHTSVVISWNHFGFSHPTAVAPGATGSLTFDPQHPEGSSVKVTIPTAQIETHVTRLTEEFKTARYFDVAHYPQATFISNKVEPQGEGRYKIHGTLTIKGHAEPVIMNARLTKQGEQPMMKVAAIGFDATTTIQRSRFGLSEALPGVADQVDLHISTEAHAK